MNTIWFPLQRVIRTVLQVIAATLIGAAAFLGIFQLIAPRVLDAVREVLPPTLYAWALGFIATVSTIAGVLARVMAIPAVNKWLTTFGAGSAPKGAVKYTFLDGTVKGLTRKQFRHLR